MLEEALKMRSPGSQDAYEDRRGRMWRGRNRGLWGVKLLGKKRVGGKTGTAAKTSEMKQRWGHKGLLWPWRDWSSNPGT